jgi:glutamate synthase (NADPH/NADH) small chain
MDDRFIEVNPGLTDEEASIAASRCLNCKNPNCVKGCPVSIMIPDFISAIKNGDIAESYKIIKTSASLPSICGRVCPQEKQCEKLCIRGFKESPVSIGALERYVSDYARTHNLHTVPNIQENGFKIAIIGSGPSGLSCAYDARKMGYDVTIYEALHKAGGVLTYGIPEFRLPKSIVSYEIGLLENMGVKFVLNTIIGKSIMMSELEKMYDAIYISTGAGLPKFMGIPGENAKQVFSANEVLTRINLMESYKTNSSTPIKLGHVACVIGGGNVAMDAARSLHRLGLEVHLIYRRSENELPARLEEVNHAKEEGIIFEYLNNPTRILTDDDLNVTGIELISMELIDDGSAKKKIMPISGSEHIINCDIIVMAIGTSINNIAFKDTNILVDENNIIKVNGTKTSIDGIYAGGDVATGASTVISACGMGKLAARDINNSLGGYNEK